MPVAQETEQLDQEEEYKPVVEETPVVEAKAEEPKPAMEVTEPMSDQIKEYVPEQVAQTEAEKLLEEEARVAKQTLVDEINQFKPD